MNLRVAGAQIPVTRDIDENLETIFRAMEFAVSEEAEVLLTPEGSLSGYTPEFETAAVEVALDKVAAKAREQKLGLALGTCFIEPDDGTCYNQIRFYDPTGDFLGFHPKTLRCGSMSDEPKGEINHYGVRPLQTYDFRGVTIGGLICNDLWANPSCTPMPDPHLTHQLAQQGAKIVFHAVNGGRSGDDWAKVNWHYHESNLLVRARSGNLWIVTTDNCYPAEMPCSAPSGVISPEGTWAVKTESLGEQFFAHTIALDN